MLFQIPTLSLFANFKKATQVALMTSFYNKTSDNIASLFFQVFFIIVLVASNQFLVKFQFFAWDLSSFSDNIFLTDYLFDCESTRRLFLKFNFSKTDLSILIAYMMHNV